VEKEPTESPKMKALCPDWEDCFYDYYSQMPRDIRLDTTSAEWEFSVNQCCGCMKCVLFREKNDCKGNCHIRNEYPQYQNDSELFALATGADLEETIDEFLEDTGGLEPSDQQLFNLMGRKIREKQKVLRKALYDE